MLVYHISFFVKIYEKKTLISKAKKENKTLKIAKIYSVKILVSFYWLLEMCVHI